MREWCHLEGVDIDEPPGLVVFIRQPHVVVQVTKTYEN